MTLLILVISLLYLVHTEQAFSQQTNNCTPHTVCIHPGDMLRYSITVNSINGSQIFDFGDIIDSDHINVVEQDQTDGNNIQNNTMILDMETGFVQSQQNSQITNPFLQVLGVPMEHNKSDSSITQTVTNFNGFKRDILVAFHTGENTTSKMEYDLETGILLDEQSTSLLTINNKVEIVEISNTLTYTNLINSDSGIQSLKNSVSIPEWVKNNAKYWSHGTIDDTTFAHGIQYMIKQGIVTIPPVQSGQPNPEVTIPTWVKQNAGFWADGQISDDDFVKGIQWLITNGIIQV